MPRPGRSRRSRKNLRPSRPLAPWGRAPGTLARSRSCNRISVAREGQAAEQSDQDHEGRDQRDQYQDQLERRRPALVPQGEEQQPGSRISGGSASRVVGLPEFRCVCLRTQTRRRNDRPIPPNPPTPSCGPHTDGGPLSARDNHSGT